MSSRSPKSPSVRLGAGIVCVLLAVWAGEGPGASSPAANPDVPSTTSPPPPPAPSTAPLTNLVFDSGTQVYLAKPGDAYGRFTFLVTNISEIPVHILNIVASCSCTKAEMPEVPWIIAPHAHTELHATMNLANKPPGDNVKILNIYSTNGTKQLWVKSVIPMPPPPMTQRQKNQEAAKADRQAVFRGDCAHCHADSSAGLMGSILYVQACGICHDSSHRASMVPDLASLNHPTDANFWRLIIAEGKEKTLMPAFARARGGPLSDEQIDSLVAYLTTDFPAEHKAAAQIQPPRPQSSLLPPPNVRPNPAPRTEVPSAIHPATP